MIRLVRGGWIFILIIFICPGFDTVFPAYPPNFELYARSPFTQTLTDSWIFNKTAVYISRRAYSSVFIPQGLPSA